ncbi:glucose dehydrogenase [Segetibacter sp. 3557_3]|uniref:PQQ-dependent sugar dehydrogenase n=1 Tax=Segetibacter sp. 3557_3 TaxID=2547429 RepID=UPI0010585081|nr:PQQ-dependent sugar dehydrogenase [Segetibacter sp. 3557_3]TDH26967.1 glucose dehydrogenase [Segetibacter sp. 3557_3]
MHRFFPLSLLLVLVVAGPASAQRGVPPRHVERSKLVSKWPQHLDFLNPMVKLLKVPDGWEISVAASGLGKVRMMQPMPNGDLYVTRRDGMDVLLLRDTTGDNRFDEVKTIEYPFRSVHGVLEQGGYLYLVSNYELRRYKINPDGMLGTMEVLKTDMPSGGQHPNRTIAFGPDGMMYMTIGTLCNDCKEVDPGVAAVWQIDPKTWKHTVFASGLRNTIGIDFHPQTGELWGADNGGDGKGNRWPPEEINRIVKDGNYGFPFVYGKQEIDKHKDDPPGEIKKVFALQTVPSVLDLPAHMAPIDFKFFKGQANIPSEYNGDALVAYHGSWNRSKLVGYKVQRIRFRDGVAVAAEDFVTGFLKPAFPVFGRKAYLGRPTGLAITEKGVIYLSDDANGVIYAIKRKS